MNPQTLEKVEKVNSTVDCVTSPKKEHLKAYL